MQYSSNRLISQTQHSINTLTNIYKGCISWNPIIIAIYMSRFFPMEEARDNARGEDTSHPDAKTPTGLTYHNLESGRSNPCSPNLPPTFPPPTSPPISRVCDITTISKKNKIVLKTMCDN